MVWPAVSRRTAGGFGAVERHRVEAQPEPRVVDDLLQEPLGVGVERVHGCTVGPTRRWAAGLSDLRGGDKRRPVGYRGQTYGTVSYARSSPCPLVTTTPWPPDC